ncbi:RNA polymerase sigma factor [Sphingobacterium sp. HJSM2_6]|uniref:RNA polymerase sigma factor n=1 Tax=Sphingobacterium sp. HJSM2_6 TaxID=3366264 RepID=UPI003BC3EDC5
MLDEEQFIRLFNQYYDRILNTLYKKIGSTETAHDLTQLTFFNLWKYKESFNKELPENIQIYRKANLVFIDWLRKEANQRKLLAEIKQNLPKAIDEVDHSLQDHLNNAMQSLPPMRKKVFKLAYIQGYSHKEIAEQLDISVKTVDAHIYKALIQLRKILSVISIIYHFYKH